MVPSSLLIESILLLTLLNINFVSSESYCYQKKLEEYKEIKINSPEKINVGPQNEYCFKYKLTNNKKKISLIFLNGNSYTGEVFIYKSHDNIKKNETDYINSVINYKIEKDPFKEINVEDYNDYVFIVIRDSKIYYFVDYILLYDSEIPINMEEGIPITIKYFMSNKQHILSFSSSKNVNIVYSSRNKGQNSIIVEKDGKEENHETDNKDLILKFEKPKEGNNTYKIIIKNEKSDSKSQEFSIIYYENIDEFKKIDKNMNMKINYLITSGTNQKQVFKFFTDISNFKHSNTINFKLDYQVKNDKYIVITNNLLLENEFSLENMGTYDFKQNQLKFDYDLYSDEYFKFFFNSNNSEKKYKYIVTKVEISEKEKYYIPKSFNISIGEETEKDIIDVKSFDKAEAKTFEISCLSYIPKYTRLIFDNSLKYFLRVPYEDYILVINGDILENEEINKKYINNNTDLLVIDGLSEVIIRAFGYQHKFNISIEKFNPEEVKIFEEQKEKNHNIFVQEYNEEQCKQGKMKYIIFIYNINLNSYGVNKISKYWTTENADLEVYYKNNTDVIEKSILPNSKNKVEKEHLFISNSHVDLFTIKCKKPGNFSIRPIKKKFNEKTYVMKESYMTSFRLTNPVEVVQLYYNIEKRPNNLYFYLLPLEGKNISIIPDYNQLFNKETTNKLFTKKIDTTKYKMDELGIKFSSEEYTTLEVAQTTDNDYCQYQVVKKNKEKITKNNFVKFLDKNTKKISIKFNNMEENIQVFYGIVNLPTNDTKFLPMAFSFKKGIKKELIKNQKIEIKNEYYNKTDNLRPYQAFILSVDKTDIIKEYEIDFSESSSLFEFIISIVSLSLSLFSVIAFVLYINKDKFKRTKEIELDAGEILLS